MKKRFLALMLTFVLVLSNMNGLAVPVYAEETKEQVDQTKKQTIIASRKGTALLADNLTVEADKECLVPIQEAERSVKVTFVPDKTDVYCIWSKSDQNTYMQLFDENDENLGWSDDEGEGMNFEFEVVLEAGVTYTLELGYYNDCTDPIPLYVTTLHEYLLNVTKEPSCTEEGEGTYTCSYCEDSYTAAIEPSHNYVDGVCADCKKLETHSGKCGDNLTWYLDVAKGSLTISGEGEMYDYEYYDEDKRTPWYEHASKIYKVIIEDGVTSVGRYAFSDTDYNGYDNLYEVELADSITELNFYCFGDCSNLSKITLPDNLRIIGMFAFVRCSDLSEIVIPESVSYIDEYAFNQTGLTTVKIPASVGVIEPGVFSSCRSLKSIEVDSKNPNYCSDQGVLYNKNKTSLVAFPGGISGEFSVPESVTDIAESAFEGCHGLTEVYLPENISDIKDYVFYWCTNLKKINIPSSVTSIGSGTFEACVELEEVILSEGLEEIGFHAFFDCRKLEKIEVPSSVTYIDEDAFYDVPLVHLLSSNVEVDEYQWGAIELHKASLENCEDCEAVSDSGTYGTNLKWSFESATGILTISGEGGMDACGTSEDTPWFSYRDRIKKIVIEEGVTSVCAYIFSGYTKLKEVDLPDTLLSIGDMAFSGTAIETIYLPDSLTTMGISVFASCAKLCNVHLPNGITAIPSGAFQYNTNLMGIVIPDNITSIGEYAFDGCTSLSEIDIHEGITSIGTDAFGSVPIIHLLTTQVENDGFNWGADEIHTVSVKECIECMTKYIYSGNCGESLMWELEGPTKTLTISGTGEMDNYASVVAPWKEYSPIIEKVIIENGVTTIGDCAFAQLKSLKEVRILGTIKKIGVYAFCESSNLTTINLPEGLEFIDMWAFAHCYVLDNVVLPSTLKEISYTVFGNCNSLSEITIPASLKVVTQGAFGYCHSLKKVTVEAGVEEIQTQTFEGCGSLEEVRFEGDAPVLGEGTFKDVTTTIYYPAGNDTWTEDIMQNYGGTLTWVSYGEVEPPVDMPFEDVSESNYYYDSVQWAYENNITSGKTETEFQPTETCTRGQVVTFLWRSQGCPEPKTTTNPFVDVSTSKFYYKAVLWAYENGITSGKDATHFQPEATVTRSQFVTFLWRAEGQPEPTISNPFVDVENGKYFTDAVLWAYEQGITTGKDATHFQPDNGCQRCQVVTFLYRAYEE